MVAAPAYATFPGTNGKIAYVQQGTGIETVNPDGSDRKLLLATCCGGVSWSPDGTKIAYGASSGGLDVADADGTNAHEVLARPPGRALEYPTWSPDQTKLAFLSFDALCQNDFCGYNELWTVNADGTGAARLPGTSVQNPGPPKWSPDGAWIAFSDAANFNSMYVIRPDGSQKTGLAGHALPLSWSPDARKILYYSTALVDLYTIKPDGTGNARLPGWPQGQDASGGASWSPDGSKIVVATPDPTCVQPQCYGSDLFVINADGSGQTNITNTPPANDYGSDWQPIPYTGYPRPRGATPLTVPLVPAYRQCTAPNRTHGGPLAYPSCNPPQQTDPYTTLGTPDANGAGAKSLGTVRFVAITGDIRITVAVSDVRCLPPTNAGVCTSANSADGPDYSGDVSLQMLLRVTDHNNHSGSGPDEAGTVMDLPLALQFSCQNTADTTVGGSCGLATTYDAFLPGGVVAGKRTIWELGQIVVNQAGPSGHEQGFTFLKGGLFIP